MEIMTKKGKNLIFISWINRDGSGVTEISEKYLKIIQDERFELIRLSITEDTLIASNFNCFVVKLKPRS